MYGGGIRNLGKLYKIHGEFKRVFQNIYRVTRLVVRNVIMILVCKTKREITRFQSI